MKKLVSTILFCILFICAFGLAAADEWAGYNWSFEKNTLYIDCPADGSNSSIQAGGPWEKYYKKAKTLELGEHVSSIFNMGPLDSVAKLIIHSESVGGENVFSQKNKLTEVVYLAPNPGIYGEMFRFTRLKKITIEDPDADYEFIDNFLFNKDHTTLYYYFDGGKGDVIVPEGVRIIASSAFANSKIKSITLPNTLVMIGEFAFSGCKQLKSITIPENVRHLGDGAFSACNSLANIAFETKTIDYNMYFDGVRLVIPEEEYSWNDAVVWTMDKDGNPIKNRWVRNGAYSLFGGTAIQEIELPVCPGLCDNMFISCKKLKRITLSEGTERFALAQATDMILYDCKNLESIFVPDSVTLYDSDYSMFNYVSKKCKLHCHEKSNAEEFAKKYTIPYEIVP